MTVSSSVDAMESDARKMGSDLFFPSRCAQNPDGDNPMNLASAASSPAPMIAGTPMDPEVERGRLEEAFAKLSIGQQWGVRADTEGLDELGYNLEMPPSEPDGKIPTLNQTGFMTPDQSEFNNKFLNFAQAQKEGFVADIGSAYGITTIPALEGGASIIANDIDLRHLLIMRKKILQNQKNGTEMLGRLFLNNQSFPEKINFPPRSLRGALLCRVAHFLTGVQMERGIEKMHDWLMPKGRVFIMTMSPYHHLLKGVLPTIYNEKLSEGDPWPGVIENMHEIAPQLSGKIPSFLHVMDKNSLGAALQRAGFAIIEEGLFDYLRPEAIKSEGQGYYGVIAEKNEIKNKS